MEIDEIDEPLSGLENESCLWDLSHPVCGYQVGVSPAKSFTVSTWPWGTLELPE
jgi:hypothetical protein